MTADPVPMLWAHQVVDGPRVLVCSDIDCALTVRSYLVGLPRTVTRVEVDPAETCSVCGNPAPLVVNLDDISAAVAIKEGASR